MFLSRAKTVLISSALILPAFSFAADTDPSQTVIDAFKNIDFSMGYTVIGAIVAGIAGFIVFQAVVKRGLGFIRKI